MADISIFTHQIKASQSYLVLSFNYRIVIVLEYTRRYFCLVPILYAYMRYIDPRNNTFMLVCLC